MERLPSVSDRPAVRYDYFPTLWQAVLFRTWALVPHDRIAAVLGTDEETLKKLRGIYMQAEGNIEEASL